MHIYKDPYAPPLAPKVPLDRPPWVPSWKDYKGRTEWWAALGYKDPDLKRGLTHGMYHFFDERDHRYLDPKVPDGTSVVGPLGKDSRYHRNHVNKWDTPGDFREFQNQVRKSCSQYKQIAEKWDISDEHPGLPVNPLLDSGYRYTHKTLGANIGLIPSARHSLFYRTWPRFWDKPMNEGCFEKGLALAKYSLPFSLFAYLAVYRQRSPPGIKLVHFFIAQLFQAIREWPFRTMPLPALYGFTFGFTSCASATFRHEDDSWNWVAASAVCGLAHSTIKSNLAQGIALAAVGSFLGAFFQIIRISHNGFGLPMNRMSQGFLPFTGPLDWKHIPLEDFQSFPDGAWATSTWATSRNRVY